MQTGARIEVYTQFPDPIYAGVPFQVKVGFYDSLGNLVDITGATPALSWEVLNGDGAVLWTEVGQISAVTSDSYRIRFTYSLLGGSYVTDYSFYALPVTPLGLTQAQAYACIKREEPVDVYTQSTDPLTSLTYVDNWSFSAMVALVYDFLKTQTDNIYPELTRDATYVQQWEQMLTGQYGLYDPTSSQTPKLLQFIRNAGFTFNPYDLAYWVTQYIYLKLNKNTFVYIQETLLPYNSHYWILNEAELGVNTFLGPSESPSQRSTVTIHVLNYDYVMDDKTKAEILFLISIWGMCGITYDIDYGHHPSDFGLIQNLGSTYKGDPRTIGIYCLQYDPNAVLKVYGLTNPYAISKLVNIQIAPASGTFYTSNVIHFTVQGNYLFGYTQDITALCSYATTTPDTLQQGEPLNQFECIDTGAGQVIASYWYFTSTANITIDPYVTTNWILNVSQLDIDTTLG